MNRVDIARFEFDYDTTWAAFFADSKLRIYSRYGGRDEHEPESRLSKASLLQTMREVLDAHRAVSADRVGKRGGVSPPTDSNSAGRGPNGTPLAKANVAPIWHPEPKSSTTPLDIPLLKKSHQGCVHCHQIREYSLLQAYHDKRFQRELLFTFPLPESLGIEIDRTHGHRVLRVRDGSPAAAAKLVAGDVVLRCADVPIRSDLDLRWALHRLPQTYEQVTLFVERQSAGSNSHTIEVQLPLPAEWRQSELSWRKSSRSVPSDWGFRGAALAKFERREAGLPETGLAIRVLSVKPRGLAQALGLQKGDVITALSGDTRERTLDRLRSDMLRRFGPGDEVQMTVRRDEQLLQLSGKFPAWFTEETTVP